MEVRGSRNNLPSDHSIPIVEAEGWSVAFFRSLAKNRRQGGNSMWLDFLLFITIGPMIGLILYFLRDTKNRTSEHLNELREHSHLVC